MSHLLHPIPRIQSAEIDGQGVPSTASQHRRSQRAPIHILDDDSLLYVFSLCRPVLLDENETQNSNILQGGEWDRERWWYKPAHVCRRWRCLILASSTLLMLSLICTHGTPVADMLAHSPPLPLIIDHLEDRRSTAKDEKGVMLALLHCDRVRRIRLLMPIPALQRLIVAFDEEFPMLEYLYIAAQTNQTTSLMLPKAFQAPQLRHLILIDFIFPIRSLLLTTAVGLVTLWLSEIPPSGYFHPSDLLQRLSLMPQLETLGILFHSAIPNRDVERQLLNTPIMTHVTLPSLRWFTFGGVSTYLEALLPRMTTPLLDKFQIFYFNQLTFSVPRLQQFVSTKENLRESRADLAFGDDNVFVAVYSSDDVSMETLYMDVSCRHLDWQVASAVQIFSALGTIFSEVEHLTFQYRNHVSSSPWHDEIDPTRWRELLRSFGNVKTIRVPVGLVKELSRSLRLEDGDSPIDLLPELKRLEYSASGDTGDAFAAFIDARQNAGRPVSLVRI